MSFYMSENTNQFNTEAGTLGVGINELGAQAGSRYVFHTMPKKFISLRPSSHQARSTGLLILVGGLVLLVGASVLFYFYFLRTKPNTSLIEQPAPIENAAPISAQVEINKP
jgi:hypothetical protein